MKLPSYNWRSLGQLLSHARPTLNDQKIVIFGAFAALLLETMLRLLEPWPLQYLIDNILLDSDFSGLNGTDPLIAATVTCLVLVAVVAARALSAYAWTIGFAVAGNRVLLAIRAKVFGHLQLLSLKFHSQNRTGDLLTRLVDDVGMVRDVVVTAAMPLLGNLFLLLTMLAVMAWLNWRLTLVVLAAAPLLLLVSKRKSKRIHHAARQQRKQVSQVAATAAEALTSIKAVQALGMHDALSGEFELANSADLTSGVKVKRLSAAMERTVDVIIGLATAATLFFGVLEVLNTRLSIGELLVFLAYLRTTAKPIRNWAKFTARIAKSSAGAERILDILDTQAEVTERDGAQALSEVTGKLEFRNVSFSYEPGKPVLENISFTILAGEKIALIGSSGAGKSTVLALMMRLYDPDHGRILLDDHDIRDLKLDNVRQQFGIALQDALLFHGTVRENIAPGRSDIETNAVEEVARQTRVSRFTDMWPDGLDTKIGERGAKLSHGERQRISLARALFRKTPFLVVDEPLNGLDPETAVALEDILNAHANSRTFLFITHDLDQASRADRILAIDKGKLAEVPKHELPYVFVSKEAHHGC